MVLFPVVMQNDTQAATEAQFKQGQAAVAIANLSTKHPCVRGPVKMLLLLCWTQNEGLVWGAVWRLGQTTEDGAQRE